MFSKVSNAVRHGALIVATSAPMLALAQASTPAEAIAAEQTKAVAVTVALLGLGIAVWGGMYLYRKFFK